MAQRAAAQPDDATAGACLICGEPLKGERTMTVDKGKVHVRCNREQVDALIRDALANGTHSTATRVVCPQCRQWCSGFFLAPMDGRSASCIQCAAKVGDKTARRALGWKE